VPSSAARVGRALLLAASSRGEPRQDPFGEREGTVDGSVPAEHDGDGHARYLGLRAVAQEAERACSDEFSYCR